MPVIDIFLLFVSCDDLLACSASCKTWLDILKHEFLWEDYRMGLGLPMPLPSLIALRQYVSSLVLIEERWLQYKVHVDRRLEAGIVRGVLSYCNPAGCCDLAELGDPRCLHSHGFAPALRDSLRSLFDVCGALPYDYVAALKTIWQPAKTFALGDIIFIDRGDPLVDNVCKDPDTNVFAVMIGYVMPGRMGGHRPGYGSGEYCIHELIMAFRVSSDGRAVDVSYTVVCYNFFSNGGIIWLEEFGLHTAAAFVAKHRDDRLGVLEGVFTERRFESFADVVCACSLEIGRISKHMRLNIRLFAPCVLYWWDAPWVDVEDSGSSSVSLPIQLVGNRPGWTGSEDGSPSSVASSSLDSTPERGDISLDDLDDNNSDSRGSSYIDHDSFEVRSLFEPA